MKYRITIEPDTNGWWLVKADDIPGAHSHGQTIARARANIAEAIAAILDLPEGAEATITLDQRILLEGDLGSAMEEVAAARSQAEKAMVAAREATERMLTLIPKYLPAIGIRDQAELLGVSYQRIAQLRPGAPRRGRRAAPTNV